MEISTFLISMKNPLTYQITRFSRIKSRTFKKSSTLNSYKILIFVPLVEIGNVENDEEETERSAEAKEERLCADEILGAVR